MTTPTTGPDFVSFQVRDVARAGAFYADVVGLVRRPSPNPDAVVFAAGSVSFAVRSPLPGTDLDAIEQPGAGVGVWFHNPDAAELHERLVAAGVPIVQPLTEGPFGMQFSFRDPDGYIVTVHSRA